MLTEMAHSSNRMRFKDKIIANIAKAIKGIQEAVFFKNQATISDGPLILRNGDRQCHKLCENLDHVFLHGLKHHSNGYWKVVTEYTHKNAVYEIQHLRNVTTDLGRGRAWIFMALNDALLESYIRCVTEQTRFLRKHYSKDALLLDQQQMSVLLTLTSGLECAVFKLEYDLPYLDLTAYPPRSRTASEVEEKEVDHITLMSVGCFSSQPSTETAASTPESSRLSGESDTASLSSLDTSALRGSSARISSVSVDSGFPGDVISIQSSKQRSLTPTDTISISSHGSAGEPDRLTRLENLISQTDDTEDPESGLEVIRLKSGKKMSSGSKKRKTDWSKKNSKRVESPVSPVSAATVVESFNRETFGSGDSLLYPDTRTSVEKFVAEKLEGDENFIDKSPISRKSPNHGEDSPSFVFGGEVLQMPKANTAAINDSRHVNDKMEGSTTSSSQSDIHKFAAETKDSLVDRFAQLDATVANIRATTITLHQHQEQASRPITLVADSCLLSPETQTVFQNEISNRCRTAPLETFTSSKDFDAGSSVFNTDICDLTDASTEVPKLNYELSEVPDDMEKEQSALEVLESRCAQLCRPVTEDVFGHRDQTSSYFAEGSTDNSKVENLDNAKCNITGELDCSDNLDSNQRLKDTDFPVRFKEPGEADEVDFYNSSSKTPKTVTGTPSFGHLQDYMDYISGHQHNQVNDKLPEHQHRENLQKQEQKDQAKNYALHLDNNTKLQIMLDIFSRSDEEFIKMFVTREGHTEGDVKVVYVLVTNHTLYIMRQKELDRKLEAELSIPLKDLSFISLSLNKQIVNIESSGPNRRKERIWLTPGDHILAQQILDCLDGAIQNVQQVTTFKSHCSIGSDEPLQIIALRKYISRDCNCDEMEVEIEDYSLVFWEDTQSNRDKQTSTSREGTMLLRTNDPFKGHVWKPVYAVLRDFMLCLFSNKSDSKPQQYIRLGGEQCVGCRLTTLQDRPHCIEIILAKGGSWFLSVASKEEVASWRQSLCLAVSEGMQDSSNLSCIPCVSVVTGQKLLLCHEDVQTKFCRTIASAKVEEVTALTVDPEVKTYCIVEFESQEIGVSSEQWVLYFSSSLEMNRFKEALSKVWREVYQIPLVANSVEDLPLQKHCQDQAVLLQNSMTMK